MKQIQIKYRRSIFSPFLTEYSGCVPENWEEVTPSQFIAITSMMKENDDVCFISSLTGIKKRIIQRLSGFHIYNIFSGFTWLREPKPRNHFIISEIHLKGNVIYSPQPKLKGITFLQFIFADSYFSDYAQAESEDDLNRLVACLYLPKDVPFSEKQIDEMAGILPSTDLCLRRAVFYNFLMVRNWLSDVYPLVFSHQENDSKTSGKSASRISQSNSWIKIFEQVVGDDIANADKYGNLPLHSALRYISNRIKQNMRK